MKCKVLVILATLTLISCSKGSADENIFHNKEINDITIGLKNYAIEKGKFIGNLMRDGMFDNLQVNNGLTDNLLKTEYNALVLSLIHI